VNAQKSPHFILSQIAGIERMERGKLSVMRETAVGPAYKLQAWEKGKNVSRYIPPDQATAVQEAIEGYQRFESLTQEYAQQIIDKTRQEIASSAKKKSPIESSSSRKTRKSSA
jgi:glycerol-3-phosphate O-acyltransferase